MSDSVVVLLSTAPSEDEAEALARALVERRLAACVNVLPGVRSYFRWQGEVEGAREVLLVIKTTEPRVEDLSRTLRELHSYDLPELIRLPVSGGSDEYLQWVRAESKPLHE